jgi:hypothetical protein
MGLLTKGKKMKVLSGGMGLLTKGKKGKFFHLLQYPVWIYGFVRPIEYC